MTTVEYPDSYKIQSAKSYYFVTVVRDILGDVCAEVLQRFFSAEKLSFQQISEKTKLGKKKLKTVLVSLLQLRCLQYELDERQKPHYMINEDGLLLLMYSGEILATIQERFPDNKEVHTVVENFLKFGTLSLEDYLQVFESVDSVEHAFHLLINEGWLVPIKGAIDFQDKFSIYKKLYKKHYDLAPKSASISEAKRKRDVRLSTEQEFQNVFEVDLKSLYQADALSGVMDQFSKNGQDEENSALAWRKINKTVSFQLSVSRFVKTLRTKYLVKFMAQKLGKISAKLYEMVLQAHEKTSVGCFRYSMDVEKFYLKIGTYLAGAADAVTSTYPTRQLNGFLAFMEDEEQEKKYCISLAEISALFLRNKVNLSNSIKFTRSSGKRARAADSDKDSGHKKIKTEDGAVEVLDPNLKQNEEQENSDSESEDDPLSMNLLISHLELMAANKVPFLKQKASGSYYVPYSSLIPELKNANYLYLVKSVCGLNEFRVLNCIIKNKLIDEKLLTNKTLLNEGDVRIAVANLLKLQAIEVQEIPKTQDRQANRSAFAYRYNVKYAHELIESSVLHEIARIWDNLNAVKENNKLLLTKVNRDDIRGHENELLSTSELNQMKWLREKELTCIIRNSRGKSVFDVFGLL